LSKDRHSSLSFDISPILFFLNERNHEMKPSHHQRDQTSPNVEKMIYILSPIIPPAPNPLHLFSDINSCQFKISRDLSSEEKRKREAEGSMPSFLYLFLFRHKYFDLSTRKKREATHNVVCSTEKYIDVMPIIMACSLCLFFVRKSPSKNEVFVFFSLPIFIIPYRKEIPNIKRSKTRLLKAKPKPNDPI